MRPLAAVLCLIGFSISPALAYGEACEPISIFSAASTTDVVEKIAATYEQNTGCSVSTIFAASGTLARQIESGAPADLFLSASDEWMDWVQNAGLVRSSNRITLLGNQLVLVVPASGNSVNLNIANKNEFINFLDDEKVAIGDPAAVPAGRYAVAALRHFGLGALLETQVVQAGSVRAALAWVARGEAPMGIVYRTDALIEDGVRISGSVPAIDGSEIIYPLALIGRTPNKAARSFYEYLQSYEAAAVFADHGFSRLSTDQ